MADPTLTYWERNPPYAAVALAALANVPINNVADPKATKETVPALQFASGDELSGVPIILRYIARAAGSSSKLYGEDPLSACQIDYWIDYACSNLVVGLGLEAACAAVNSYLALRTYLVGHHPTVADVAAWGQLQACPMWKKIYTSGSIPHLKRWFDHLSNSLPQLAAAADALDWKKKPTERAATANAGGAASTSGQDSNPTGSFDLGLANVVVGKVVTRFPPEPSGYLHVGHAKAALLNQYIADMYKGKCLVRFDDTNPSKEKDEFVTNIIADMKELGLKCDAITHTSDYFPQMLDLGERMIRAGVLYADDTPVDKMREERTEGVASKRRNRSVEENLAIWKEMQEGSEVGLANCIRIKMDMQALNKALRDPVCFRCNLTPHWRTGTKYKVYPTYDFACPFVDALEGVTHALRTSEYKDREAQYYWVLKEQQKAWPGLPNVTIWDYARLNFVYTVLSKRKLTWFVETGRVEGWNDARMPTVQGMLRRGLTLEALKEFIIGQGASKNITYQEWDKIWSINKRIIDSISPRHTAVEQAGKVTVKLTGAPSTAERTTIPKHKKNAAVGTKELVKLDTILIDQADAVLLTENEEVTLMDWGNAIIKSITRDAASGAVTAIDAQLHLEGDFKKTKLKLTWLSAVPELVPLMLVDFGYLINKKKLDEDDDFAAHVNDVTRLDTPALGDVNMASLAAGDVIQLERKGYYRVDAPAANGQPAVLYNIPDGRAKTMMGGVAGQLPKKQ